MTTSDSMPPERPVDVLRLTLFGVASLRRGALEADLPDRAYALLTYLAAQPGSAAKREPLRTLLWGESEPAKANDSLRQLLSRLRRAQTFLGADLIGFDGDYIRLLVKDETVDLLAFYRGDPHAAIKVGRANEVTAWLGLYGGDLLATIRPTASAFDAWLLEYREHLRERYLAAVGEALDAPGLINDEAALALAGRVRLMEPASDPACRAAMRIHARRDNPEAACRAYETYRKALKAAYGIEPSHRTRELARGLGLLAGAAERRDPGMRAPAEVASQAAEQRTPRQAACPRLVILPPVTILRDEDTRRLAGAFIEDVTVGLSRYRSFTILAPHSARAMAEECGEELAGRHDADYVVHTALKPTDRGLAMTFRLAGPPDNRVLSVSEVDWRSDKLNDVFGHLVRKVVHALVDAIEKTTLLLPAVSPDASAYRLYLEGRQCLTSIDLPNLRRAKRWFREASARAQTYASPLIGLARTTMMEWFVLGMPADNSLAEAMALADKGLSLDPFDWRGLREKALSCLWLRRHAECLALFEEAMLLGPNDADLIADYADALAHCGEPERGLEFHERAMRLNPIPPDYYVWIKGSILFQTHRYEAALDTMRPISNNPATSRLLAACAARAGRRGEARAYARTLRDVYPDFSSDHLWRISPNRLREDTSHFIESLKLAGVD